MDNLFVFQEGFDTIDQEILKRAVKESYKQNCDGYIELSQGETLGLYLERAASRPSVNGVTKRRYSIVPVGSIEFARRFLEEMQPIEVPETLQRFCRRDYRIMKGSVLPSTDSDRYFFKDATELKSWNSALCDGDVARYIDPEHMYVFSEKVRFDAEYRVYVYRDVIQAVQRYLGEPTLFPKEGPHIGWLMPTGKNRIRKPTRLMSAYGAAYRAPLRSLSKYIRLLPAGCTDLTEMRFRICWRKARSGTGSSKLNGMQKGTLNASPFCTADYCELPRLSPSH